MYLRQRDYDRVIQPQELQEYINTDSGIQQMAYLTALAQVKSKLKQKFYVDFEFTDTDPFSYTSSYTGNGRIELNFPAYVPTNTYNIGDLVSNVTSQYICKVNGTTGAFTSANFYLIGTLYDIWYLQLPYPLFDINKKYKVGDPVFWKGNIYTASLSSVNYTADDRLQDVFQTPRFRNIFPDCPINGVKAWGNPIPYNITAVAPKVPLTNWTPWSSVANYTINVLATFGGVLYISNKASLNITPGTDPTAWSPITWVFGDNRDQLCVDMMLKMVVWDMSARIMLDASPIVRENDMKSANRMLDALALGEINQDKLILIETGVGITTYSGGAQKNVNLW